MIMSILYFIVQPIYETEQTRKNVLSCLKQGQKSLWKFKTRCNVKFTELIKDHKAGI